MTQRSVTALGLTLALALAMFVVFPTYQLEGQSGGLHATVVPSEHYDTSPPLSSMPPSPPSPKGYVLETPTRYGYSPLEGADTEDLAADEATADPVLQDELGPGNMPAPIVNFEGIGSGDNPFNLLPPDTNGDVGPNHYVQMLNVSFAVWDKSGNLLLEPVPNNTLWQGFGGI